MKNLALTLTAVLFFLGSVVAQDTKEAEHQVSINIPTVAIIDVEDADGEAQSISLTPDISALEAGEAVDFSTATDNSLWLNYTSVVDNGGKRKISARVKNGNLPVGIDLMLKVDGITSGNGATGQVSSSTAVKLNGGGTEIVKDIRSCYTESGSGKGHRLTYSLDMNDSQYINLLADEYTVTIMYTISDN